MADNYRNDANDIVNGFNFMSEGMSLSGCTEVIKPYKNETFKAERSNFNKNVQILTNLYQKSE